MKQYRFDEDQADPLDRARSFGIFFLFFVFNSAILSVEIRVIIIISIIKVK